MTWEVIQGDCLDVMRSMPDNSVDSVVTDPPAGISFMSREWDSDRGGRDAWIAWLSEVLTECNRVMKPGAHALIWAIPRTSHWTGMAIENAGLTVRDVITHLYGSGFPKSMAVDKAIDKMAGAERKVVGPNPWNHVKGTQGNKGRMVRDGYISHGGIQTNITAPATPEAEQWQGFGTALKPSADFWFLARKPLAEKTIAANVLEWGTGAINVDGCRVGTTDGLQRPERRGKGNTGGWANYSQPPGQYGTPDGAGRWPPNTLLSHTPECVPVGTKRVKGSKGVRGRGSTIYANGKGFANTLAEVGQEVGYTDPDGMETVAAWECAEGCPVAALDAQSGTVRSSCHVNRSDTLRVRDGFISAQGSAIPGVNTYNDTGGASRFFPVFEPEYDVPFRYVAKASRAERNRGLGGMLERDSKIDAYRLVKRNPNTGKPNNTRASANGHPTVKPVRLMEWLVRLVTPPGGICLDPFCGSGSTGVASVNQGFSFIGIEREPEYAEIAKRRIEHAAKQVKQLELVPE